MGSDNVKVPILYLFPNEKKAEIGVAQEFTYI